MTPGAQSSQAYPAFTETPTIVHGHPATAVPVLDEEALRKEAEIQAAREAKQKVKAEKAAAKAAAKAKAEEEKAAEDARKAAAKAAAEAEEEAEVEGAKKRLNSELAWCIAQLDAGLLRPGEDPAPEHPQGQQVYLQRQWHLQMYHREHQ